MKRFSANMHWSCYRCRVKEDERGHFVTHYDHAAAVARLKEAGEKLALHTRHYSLCPSYNTWDAECTCGRDEALAAWRKAKEEA
jgi:hypothetical protein